MKKAVYIACLPILLLTLNFTTGLAQQAIGPRLVIEERLFDAKKVKEGKVIEHTFKVLNTGDRRLEIKRVNPG